MDESRRAELVGQASEGDQDALQALLIFYHRPLKTAVDRQFDERLRRYLEPEDVLQEAYARAYRAMRGARFNGSAAFYRWLETIALNQLKNFKKSLRRQKRNPVRQRGNVPRSATSVADLAQRLTAPDSTPSHKFARKEAVAALLTSLARLTDDQRHVIRLRYLEGHSVADVAARLEKSESAVHMLCHRGLKSLRTLLVSITHYLSGR